MHFYSIPRGELLKTPIKTFWLLACNVDRLRAEADMRLLPLLNAAQSKEGTEQASRQLKAELGEVYRKRPVYERSKMRELMRQIAVEDKKRGVTPLKGD